jgi:hypothetical protein
VVPFQRSPVDLYQVSDLMHAGDAVRAFLVTARTNPLVFLYFGGGGFLLVSTVRGIGGGLRSGLSAGLQYRLLRLFGLPDDIIRDEMRRRDRGRDA